MKKILLSALFTVVCFSVLAQTKKTKTGRTNLRMEDTSAFVFSKQSMLSLSMYDLFFTNVSLNYEFFRRDGQMGFQLPLSINAGGMPDTSDYNVQNVGQFISQKNRIFQTGFGFNYYPNGQAKTTYFVGMNFLAGWFYYWHYTYGHNSTGNTYPYYNSVYVVSDERLIATNVSGVIHGGILLNPRERLTFTLKAGIGLRRYSTIYTEYTFSIVQFDACLGFKF